MMHMSAGWHEELDRKLSQHSLGELKFGSKTALNRRVRGNQKSSWPTHHASPTELRNLKQ